jgi:hypothetical protein
MTPISELTDEDDYPLHEKLCERDVGDLAREILRLRERATLAEIRLGLVKHLLDCGHIEDDRTESLFREAINFEVPNA